MSTPAPESLGRPASRCRSVRRWNFSPTPIPTHELLREAGPVVYLDKWKVYGVARYAEVHAVLNDPATFCSSRGVGLSDFAKEKPWRPPSLMLEADPPRTTAPAPCSTKVLSPP